MPLAVAVRGRLANPGVYTSAVAFLAVSLAAAAFGLDRRAYAWIGTPDRHFGWLTWVLCFGAFAVARRSDRQPVVRAAAVASAVVGVWVIAELLGWEPVHLIGAGSRPVGPLGSSAYLGAAAVLLAPIALTLGSRFGYVAGALGFVALVASGARAAWVGALVAGFAWLVRRRPPVRVVAGAAVVAVALAFAFGVAGRVPDLVNDRDGGMRGRLDEWRVAERVVRAHPWLGVGPEGYRIAFAQSVDVRYERVHGREQLPDRAHSALLDVATTTGVFGALAYLALLAVVGRRLIASRDPIAYALLAYFVQSLFLFPLAELDPIAWLLAGAVLHSPGNSPGFPRAVAWRIGAAAIAAVALVAGVLGLVADREARHTLAALADERLPHGTGAAHLRPDDIRYQLVAAHAAAARGTPSGFTDALVHIDDALHVSPRDPVVRLERVSVLLGKAALTNDQRDIAAATTAAERLVRDDPNNAEAWRRRAAAAALAGDQATVRRAVARAKKLDGTRSGS